MKRGNRETIGILLLLAVFFLMPRSVVARLSFQMGSLSLAFDELAVLFLLLILMLKKVRKGPRNVPDRFYRQYLCLVTLVFFVSIGKGLWCGHDLALTVASYVTLMVPALIAQRLERRSFFSRKIPLATTTVGCAVALQIVLVQVFPELVMNYFPGNLEKQMMLQVVFRTFTTVGAATVTGPFLLVSSALGAIQYLSGGKRSLLLLLMSGFTALGCVLTLSRSSVLALVAFYVVFFYLDTKKKRVYWTTLILLSLLIGYAYSHLLPESYRRFTGTLDSEQSNELRVERLSSSIKMVERSPLLGVGVGQGFSRLYESDPAERIGKNGPLRIGNPHNQHLGFWMEGGTFFLLLFETAFFFFCLRNLWKRRWRGPLFLSVYLVILLFFTVFMTETILSLSMRTGLIFWIAFYAVSVEKVSGPGDYVSTEERPLEEC